MNRLSLATQQLRSSIASARQLPAVFWLVALLAVTSLWRNSRLSRDIIVLEAELEFAVMRIDELEASLERVDDLETKVGELDFETQRLRYR